MNDKPSQLNSLFSRRQNVLRHGADVRPAEKQRRAGRGRSALRWLATSFGQPLTGRLLLVVSFLLLGFSLGLSRNAALGAGERPQAGSATGRAAAAGLPAVEESFTFGPPANLEPEKKPGKAPTGNVGGRPEAGPGNAGAEVVLALCYSPDGQVLATAGEGKTVKLWDVGRTAAGSTPGPARLLASLTGHSEAVTAVAFSPDGKLLATASYDQTVRLWDRAALKELRTLKGHSNAVACVAFAPDGLTLASGGFDKTVRLWEVATGKELAQVKGHKAAVRTLAFSPARGGEKLLASAGGDRDVCLWDLSDRTRPTEKARLSSHTGAVRALAFAPDGLTLATAGEDKPTPMGFGAFDTSSVVRLWEVGNLGKGTPEEAGVLEGHTASVMTLAYSPGGSVLVTGSLDGTVRLWDTAARMSKGVLPGHPRGVTCVAFAPGGRQIASAGEDKTVKLRNAIPPALQPVATLPGAKDQSWFALYAPDGRGLALGGEDKAIRLRHPGAGRMWGTLPGRFSQVNGVAFSRDGKTLATACQDKTILLWNMATRTVKAKLEGHKLPVLRVAFSPDGKTLASSGGTADNSRVVAERTPLGEMKLWDLTTGKEKASLAGHGDTVFALAFSRDGKTLVSGSRDGYVMLWDPATGKKRLTLSNYDAEVRALAFSPDNKTLATGGDDAIRLWDPATGKELRQIEITGSTTSSLAFSRDGELLAGAVVPPERGPFFGGRQPTGIGTVRVWDVGTGKLRADLKGHKSSRVTAVVFAPDGKTLASASAAPPGFAPPGGAPGGQSGEVLLWDMGGKQAELLVSLQGHQGSASALAFAPDGRTLVSAGGRPGGPRLFGDGPGGDGEVLLWRIPQAGSRGMLEGHAGPVGCASYSSDGKTLATGGQDRTVKLWDTATCTERATLKGFANPPLRVRFSPDGKTLAVVCRSEKTVTLWNLAGKTILTGHTLEVTDVAFAPEGRRLATASGPATTARPGKDKGGAGGIESGGEVKLWDVNIGKEIASLPLQPHGVRSLAFSPDGRTLAVACGQEVSLWDPAGSTKLKRWQLAGPVCRVVYAPGGATLAVGLASGAVTLHEASTGRTLATLEGQAGTLRSLSFSPDGRMLAAAVLEGPTKVWQLPAR